MLYTKYSVVGICTVYIKDIHICLYELKVKMNCTYIYINILYVLLFVFRALVYQHQLVRQHVPIRQQRARQTTSAPSRLRCRKDVRKGVRQKNHKNGRIVARRVARSGLIINRDILNSNILLVRKRCQLLLTFQEQIWLYKLINP